MRRWIAAATVMLCGAPAHADRPVCNVVTDEADQISQIGAVIDPAFDRLLIETGPQFAKLEIAPGSGVRRTPSATKDIGLYIYWIGNQPADADWREPGGIGYAFGGFGLVWPNFQRADGTRIKVLRTVLTLGEAVSDQTTTFESAATAATTGQVVPLSESMTRERPHGWAHRDISSDAYETWARAMGDLEELKVTFHDGAAEAPFASARIAWPWGVLANARAVRDIQAFRKAMASGERACSTDGPRAFVAD